MVVRRGPGVPDCLGEGWNEVQIDHEMVWSKVKNTVRGTWNLQREDTVRDPGNELRLAAAFHA